MAESPQSRTAQHMLALDVTTRVHGAAAARVAQDVSALLFAKGDPASLSNEALDALSREVPFTEVAGLANAVDALVGLGLAASKGAARRLVEQGGATINGRRVNDPVESVGEPLKGRYFLVRKGARDYGLIRTAE